MTSASWKGKATSGIAAASVVLAVVFAIVGLVDVARSPGSSQDAVYALIVPTAFGTPFVLATSVWTGLRAERRPFLNSLAVALVSEILLLVLYRAACL